MGLLTCAGPALTQMLLIVDRLRGLLPAGIKSGARTSLAKAGMLVLLGTVMAAVYLFEPTKVRVRGESGACRSLGSIEAHGGAVKPEWQPIFGWCLGGDPAPPEHIRAR
jgi:hypothetical protein